MLFRLVLRFFLLLIFFAVLRSLVITVVRFFSQLTGAHQSPPQRAQATTAEIGGELKQDPVCGTFVPTSSSLKKTINGELVYFCSATCRDRFKVA